MISSVNIKNTILLLLLLVFNNAYTQTKKNIKLTIQPFFGDLKFKLNQNYYSSADNDSIRVETLKFYISEIEFINDNEHSWKEKNSYHLIDFENNESQTILLNVAKNTHTTQLKFNIGIDSITSNSGALSGDLDPVNGMYWAWQSGYVNFKMEGTSPICETRKHQFQFHLGGYKQPFYAMQRITLPISYLDDNTLQIDFNLAPIFNGISLKETHSIMIPCKDGMNLSKVVAQLFSTHAL